MSKLKIKIDKYIGIYLFIIIIIFNGFITNFVRIGDKNWGTILNDGLIVFFLIRYIFLVKWRALKGFYQINPMIILFIIYIISTIFVSIVSYKSMYEFLGGIRNHILYYMMFIVFYNFFIINGKISIQKIYKFISSSTLIICAYGILQYCCQNILPKEFLTLNDATQFTIMGITNYRSNGLIGDMLAFGGFTVISMLMNLSYLINTRAKKKQYLILLIPTIACIFSYSRISILLYFAIMFGFYILNANKKVANKLLVLIGVLILLIFFILYTDLGQGLLQRFTNIDINNSSDAPRLETYIRAIILIKDNMFWGLGFGTQMTCALDMGKRIITDGYWWECMLDLGIPCFIFLMLFIIFSIIRIGFINKKIPMKYSRTYLSTYFFVAIYFFIASFLNSALEAKINLLLMIILLAMSEASIFFEQHMKYD